MSKVKISPWKVLLLFCFSFILYFCLVFFLSPEQIWPFLHMLMSVLLTGVAAFWLFLLQSRIATSDLIERQKSLMLEEIDIITRTLRQTENFRITVGEQDIFEGPLITFLNPVAIESAISDGFFSTCITKKLIYLAFLIRINKHQAEFFLLNHTIHYDKSADERKDIYEKASNNLTSNSEEILKTCEEVREILQSNKVK